MVRFAPALTSLALVAVLVVCPRPAEGCFVVAPMGQGTTIISESALIVYDSATKTEHFIRTADFHSASADFGFLVPTPTKPELFEASADVFGELAEITKRRKEVKIKWKPLQLWGESQRAFSSIGSAIKPGGGEVSQASRNRVQVVEQKRVGRYEAAVLQASEPKLLNEWLEANGYTAPPNLADWFGAYTANGWYLTAFKIAGDAAGDLSSAAVRISFTADRPFYPYREPAGSGNGSRALRVFVLSDARMSGTIGQNNGAKAWPGRTEWSNKVPAKKLASAVEMGKLSDTVGGREWHLTEFLDQSSPRPGTDELYFERAVDQANVEREPMIEWVEIDPWSWVLIVVALLLLTLVWLGSKRVKPAAKA